MSTYCFIVLCCSAEVQLPTLKIISNLVSGPPELTDSVVSEYELESYNVCTLQYIIYNAVYSICIKIIKCLFCLHIVIKLYGKCENKLYFQRTLLLRVSIP